MTNVNGFPNLLSLPNVQSLKYTPIQLIPSRCQLAPEMTPIHPQKPTLSQALPNFLLLGWQTTINGYFQKGPSTSYINNSITQSKALSWMTFPSVVAFPHAPNIEHVPLVSSPIIWMRRNSLRGTPLASDIPLIYSQYFLLVQGQVILQVRSRAAPTNKPDVGFLRKAGNFFGKISSNYPLRQSQTSQTILLIQSLKRDPWAQPI